MDLITYLEKFSVNKAKLPKRSLVLGLGPTAKLISNVDLNDRYIVTLNGAWKLHKSDVCITIHPLETFYKVKNTDFKMIPSVIVVGLEKWKSAIHTLKINNPELIDYIGKNVTVVTFTYRVSSKDSLPHESKEYGRIPQLVHRQDGNFLYVWTSISQTAMHFLYKCRFDAIELLGCEAVAYESKSSLLEHAYATRWNGVPASYRLSTYSSGNVEVGDIFRSFGVKIYTVIPLLSLNQDSFDRQFANFIKNKNKTNEDYSKMKIKIVGYASYLITKILGRTAALFLYKKIGMKLLKIKSYLRGKSFITKFYTNLYYYYLKYWKLKPGSNILKASGNYYLPKYLNLNNSSVISLGIGNDLSFEKALLDEFSNIDLHIADPTPEVVKEIKNRQEKVIGNSDEKKDFKWKQNTLPYINEILEKVNFHPFGASNKNESLVFYRKPNGLNSSAVKLHNSYPSDKVEMLDILEFIEKLRWPLTLLKLDIEGFAPRVIKRILTETNLRPVIVGEFEIFSIGEPLFMVKEVHEIINALESSKYKIYRTIANNKKTIEFACIPE